MTQRERLNEARRHYRQARAYLDLCNRLPYMRRERGMALTMCQTTKRRLKAEAERTEGWLEGVEQAKKVYLYLGRAQGARAQAEEERLYEQRRALNRSLRRY